MTGRGTRIAHELGRPLRLVFRSRVAADVEPVEPVDDRPPEIEFVAYAEDCILSGHVRLAADRLSDLVNDHAELELIDVLVADLAGGDGFEVHQLHINREEILILHATGPRGRVDRRQRMRQHPIVAKLGPYEVRGYIHALPGSDPIDGLRRRRPIVALTDALISFTVGRESVSRRVSTVLINRELADWIVDGTDEDDELAGIEMPVDTTGPLLKDFTGDILGWIPMADDDQRPAADATPDRLSAGADATEDAGEDADDPTLEDAAGAA